MLVSLNVMKLMYVFLSFPSISYENLKEVMFHNADSLQLWLFGGDVTLSITTLSIVTLTMNNTQH
jgi:hypothetical protein